MISKLYFEVSKDGWIAELELTDFTSEQEFLLRADEYLKILKKKVDEFHVNKQQG